MNSGNKKKLNVFDEIKDQLLADGFQEGTFSYEMNFRARQLQECQARRGLTRCQDCTYSMFCNLLASHRSDQAEVARLKRLEKEQKGKGG